MLDSDMDSLGDDSVSDLLVDNDSDGSGVDVEDSTGAAVVVFIGHTLVDGSIDHDVDDISDLVGGQGLRDVHCSVCSESLSEFVSGSSLVSVAVSHLW